MRKTIVPLCLLTIVAVVFDVVLHAKPAPILFWTVQVRHVKVAAGSFDTSRVLGQLMLGGDQTVVGFSCIRAADDSDVDCYIASRMTE
jgi:hypothetical protein